MTSDPRPDAQNGSGKSADRQVWAIAGPAIIANSSAPLVGLVDTWAIGHLPVATHLAAVGVGATVFSFIFWSFGFLRMSTTGLIAQAHGRGDREAQRRVMVRSLALGLLVAAILIATQSALFSLSVAAVGPEPAIAQLFGEYFHIRIWSAPAVLATYAFTGYLIGIAKAKAALVVQLVLNISNAGLNLLFVLGFGMGADGIALGSLIAEWSAAFVGLAMLTHFLGGRALLATLLSGLTWTYDGFRHLLETNVFIFVRTLILLTALTMVMRQANGISEGAVAASHVMNVFMLLISLGLDAFAYAVEALAGAAYGKGVRHDFKKWVWVTSKWAIGASVAYSLAFYWFGADIIGGLTDVASVRAAAVGALPAIIWLPVVSVWCYQFDGIFIGATAAKAMMVTMLISFAVFMALVGPMTDSMGLLGLWWTVVIFLGCRGLSQAVYYPFIERKIGEQPAGA